MHNNNFTATLTQTIRKPPILYLKLRPKLDEISEEIKTLKSEKVGHILDSASTSRTREELAKRITEVYTGLEEGLLRKIKELREAVLEMIPKEPSSNDREAQRTYLEEKNKFELLFYYVEQFLNKFDGFLSELMKKISTFYGRLWEDYKKGEKDIEKRAKDFYKSLKKTYDSMLKQLDLSSIQVSKL